MREFNEFEKNIIQAISNGTNPSISKLMIENILHNRLLKYNEQHKNFVLLATQKDNKALDRLFDFISLFDYLEENRLIFIHSLSESEKLGYFSKNWKLDEKKKKITDLSGKEIPPGNHYSIPTNVCAKIEKLLRSFFHPNTELRNLVANNFESHTQKQLKEAKKQTKYTLGAFVIAIITLIATLFINFSHENNIKINENQFQQLKNINNNSNNTKSSSIDKKYDNIHFEKVDSLENKKL